MKKMLLLVLLCGCFQITKAQKFKAGVFAGIAASQISGDNLSGFNKPGLFAGVFTNIFFKEKYGLQLELYYIQKGSRKVAKNGNLDTYKLNLQYIEMPLLFKWNFAKRFYLEVGPALGVLMKTSGVEKDYGGVIPNSKIQEFNRFDYCVVGGLGIHINKHFKVNIRGENSFIPVRKPILNSSMPDRLQYNSSLLLSLIYQI
ncbi:MAG: porin family protein [Bacteroidota bacterium]